MSRVLKSIESSRKASTTRINRIMSSLSTQFIRMLSIVVLILSMMSSTQSAIINRNRRAVEDYYYGNSVVHNVVSDRMFGGPTSLGWAQVPHVYSPMFSPVFGRK